MLTTRKEFTIHYKNGIVTYQSPNVERWFGWKPSDIIGTLGVSLIHPGDIEFLTKELEELLKTPGLTKNAEYRTKCKDSTYIYINLTAINLINNENINGMLLNYRDITERKLIENESIKIEALFRDQQKLESLGTLATEVAHEINDPLNGILNYAQIIFYTSDPSSETSNYSNEIIYETERIATIAKNLLQFSRNNTSAFYSTNLQNIVDSTLSLVKSIFKHDQIDFQMKIPKDLPDIQCRKQQIQQVLMSLITNTRDALNEKYPEYNANKICKMYCKQFTRKNTAWVRIIV